MSIYDYNTRYLEQVARINGFYQKGDNREALLAKIKHLLKPPKKITEAVSKIPTERLKHQASMLGLPIDIYNAKNMQELYDDIHKVLEDRKLPDEYKDIRELGREEKCRVFSRNTEVDAKLRARIAEVALLTADQLKKAASSIGIPKVAHLDRSTLCALIKKEIERVETRGGEFLDEVVSRSGKRIILENTYDNYKIPDEEKLTITQLSQSLPNGPNQIKLSPHQILPAEYLYDHRGMILLHNVGTGKTFAAINASQVLLRRGVVKKVVVITPTSLQHNFIKQFKDFNKDLASDLRYTYYTPSSFYNAMKKEKIVTTEETLLIIDEAHNYRTNIWDDRGVKDDQKVDAQDYTNLNGKGRRVRAVFRYLSSPFVTRVLLLTATPLVNGDYDLENLQAMVEGRAPRTEEKKIQDMYRDQCYIHYYDTPPKEKDLFPRVENHTKFYQMSSTYYEKYFAIQKGKLPGSEMFKGGSLSMFYNGVRRAANKLDLEVSEKLAALINMIKKNVEANPRVRILAYSSWLEAGLASITRQLNEIGIKTVSVMGKMNKESRRQSVEKFNTGQANVLLISRAGGEGLDLVATNIVYILEPTWNDAAIQQIIGRAVRRNSHASLPPAERVVHVYSMMLLKPVESELVRRRTNPRWGALSNRLFTDDEVSDLKKISEDFDSDLNQLRKVTYEHEDKHKSVLDDEYLSIDLYLYKFIRKKQKKIDQSIEYLKTRSSQCHHLERIQQEMDRFVPPPPIIEEKEDMLSLDELKERIKNLMGQDTIIFEQSFDEKVPYDKSFPMITFKDVIEEVKKSGSSEFRNLEENKKLKYYAVLDPKTREFKFVFYYKLRDNIVSEDIIMIE